MQTDYELDAELDERIEDDDWTTDDGGVRFYQNGRLRLDATDMTTEQTKRAIARIMRKDNYFPNFWSLSDHGNFWPWGQASRLRSTLQTTSSIRRCYR